jgi:hypothetical protein
MRYGGFLRTNNGQFAWNKLLAQDEWEDLEATPDSRAERQIAPWILLGALIIGCGNLIYAFVELLKAT